MTLNKCRGFFFLIFTWESYHERGTYKPLKSLIVKYIQRQNFKNSKGVKMLLIPQEKHTTRLMSLKGICYRVIFTNCVHFIQFEFQTKEVTFLIIIPSNIKSLRFYWKNINFVEKMSELHTWFCLTFSFLNVNTKNIYVHTNCNS